MKIWVAVVRHVHGYNAYSDKTEAGLTSQLAAYARANWGPEGVEGPIPKDDSEAIDRYFEYMDAVGTEELVVRCEQSDLPDT
jgi:hypothetical protein